jgi:hypothetical protein
MNEGGEDPPVALGDLELRVPLNAKAKASLQNLDAFDNPIRRDGIDEDSVRRIAGRLMMSAIDRHLGDADDAAKKSPVAHHNPMARLVPRIWLLMGEGAWDFIRNVLNEGSSEDDMKQLLTAANTQNRQIRRKGGFGHGELERRARLLDFDAGVAEGRAKQHRIDIEVPSGDDQSINHAKVLCDLILPVGQQHGQSASPRNRSAVILAERHPGKAGIASWLPTIARLLTINGDPDDGSGHTSNFRRMPAARQQARQMVNE